MKQYFLFFFRHVKWSNSIGMGSPYRAIWTLMMPWEVEWAIMNSFFSSYFVSFWSHHRWAHSIYNWFWSIFLYSLVMTQYLITNLTIWSPMMSRKVKFGTKISSFSSSFVFNLNIYGPIQFIIASGQISLCSKSWHVLVAWHHITSLIHWIS